MSYKMTNILTLICFVPSANPNKDGNKRDAKVGKEVEEEGGEGVEGQEDGEAAGTVGHALDLLLLNKNMQIRTTRFVLKNGNPTKMVKAVPDSLSLYLEVEKS